MMLSDLNSAGDVGSSSSRIARQTFELANDVIPLDPRADAVFAYDEEEQKAVRNNAPWKSDPNFFQRVRISSAALIKMVIHARAGGIYEVMGTMTGKVDVEERTIYIMDAFALPVEGTETRVNAGDEAYEFMVEWQESSKKVGRLENVIGWYHSHPGYRPWLSGIDVGTQMTNQQYQDPFVAVVIDPFHTISAGRVDIGAFRTYPDDYKPSISGASDSQSIPLNKIEDFGVHADRYYALKVDFYKSTLDSQLFDMLWNKYWVSTLAQSPVVVNRAYAVGQLEDLAEKLARSETSVKRRAGGGAIGATLASLGGGRTGGGNTAVASGSSDAAAAAKGSANTRETDTNRIQRIVADLKKRERDTPLAKAASESGKISLEAQCGMIGQVLKDALFNRGAAGAPLPPAV